MESHSYFLAREQRRDSPPTSHSSTSASTSTDLKSDTTSTSPTTPFYNNMATAATIPIPRMPPSHSPTYPVQPASTSTLSTSSSSSRHQKDRSPSTGAGAGSGRSPPNLSSYRSHPYARRHSNAQDKDTSSNRIHLPPPGSGTSFNLSGNDQRSPRDAHPPTDAPWRSTSDRPHAHRITSGGSGSGKGSGFNLPPIHTMTGTGRASPTFPPPMLSLSSTGSGGGARPNSDHRNSPRMYPPSINVGISNNPNSRPGFSTLPSYDRSPTGLSPIAATSIYNEQEKERFREYERERERVEARDRDRDEDRNRRHSHSHSHHQSSKRVHHSQSQSHLQHQQHSAVPPPNHGGYFDAPSPPLRALALAPATATTALPLQYGSYPGSGPGPSSIARSRSQSSGSGLSRPGATTHSSEEGMEGITPHQHQQLGMDMGLGAQGQGREAAAAAAAGAGAGAGQTTGQSRRLAHLMSEQKRRESINSGFQALRVALPSSLPTDSKAIILRKAVAHITHLENVLRRADVDWSDSPPPMAMTMPSGRHQNVGGEVGYWMDELDDERERERDRIKWEE